MLTDDKGNSSGTLKRAMNSETRSAQRLQVGQIVLQVLLLVVFLGSTSQRHSRATAGVFGVLFAYVGVYGGMGLIAVAGMKWNIIGFFVLPFVLVSICIGDMLILAIALDKRCREYDSKAPRVDAVPKWMEHHAGPLTSKWLIILVFFAVMAASPFPVISNTACAAVAAVMALWLLMLTAFPAVLVLDLKRQQADRAELCCLFLKFSGKAPLSYELSVAPHLEHLAAQFCPNIGNRALQSAVVSGFVALVVVSAIKLGALPLGFQFDKLPADGTFLQQYFRDRLEHFPVYDAALSFASGDVSDPRVQLTMLKYVNPCVKARVHACVHLHKPCIRRTPSARASMHPAHAFYVAYSIFIRRSRLRSRFWEDFEEVLNLRTPNDSEYLWTARFAHFANPTLCRRSLLLGNCGHDVTVDVDGESKTCDIGSFYPNVYGSKLLDEGGVCLNVSDFNTRLPAPAPCNDMVQLLRARDGNLIGLPLDCLVCLQLCQVSFQEASERTGCALQCLMPPDSQPIVELSDELLRSGYEQFCPVVNRNQTDLHYQRCLSEWWRRDKLVDLSVPQLRTRNSLNETGELSKVVSRLTDDVEFPIFYSAAGGPPATWSLRIHNTKDALELIKQTRRVCDYHPVVQPVRTEQNSFNLPSPPIKCFMHGAPFDYWEQFFAIEASMYGLLAAATGRIR